MITLGILTDIHISQPGTPPVRWHDDLRLDEAGDRYSAALTRLAEHQPDAIVVLGDLAHLGDDASLDEFVDRSDQVNRPILAIPGNHDILESPTGLATAVHRRAPRHVVNATASDSMVGTVPVHGVGVRNTVDIHRYASGGPVARTGPAIVLSHFPVIGFTDIARRAGIRYAGDLVDRADLESALTDDPSPVVVLSGHLHLRAARSSGQMLQLCFGALVEPPFDLCLATIDLDGLTPRVDATFLGPQHDVPSVQLPSTASFVGGPDGWNRLT